MTYVWLNAAFLAVAMVFWAVAMALHGVRARVRIASGEVTATPQPRRRLAILFITLAVLLVLTGIFDNVIVGLGIVSYDDTKTLGVLVGVAPVEDFAYAIAAVFVLPALWLVLPARRPR